MGIPINWETLVSKVDAPFCFTCKQSEGPYNYWRHQHMFREIPGGTEIEDIINYEIPYGPIGQLANSLFVKKQLKGIFEHRHKVLENHFGVMKEEFVFA